MYFDVYVQVRESKSDLQIMNLNKSASSCRLSILPFTFGFSRSIHE